MKQSNLFTKIKSYLIILGSSFIITFLLWFLFNNLKIYFFDIFTLLRFWFLVSLIILINYFVYKRIAIYVKHKSKIILMLIIGSVFGLIVMIYTGTSPAYPGARFVAFTFGLPYALFGGLIDYLCPPNNFYYELIMACPFMIYPPLFMFGYYLFVKFKERKKEK